MRFRSDSLLPSPSKSKSNFELLLSNPSQAELFRKVLYRRSEKQRFKLFRDKVAKITNKTYLSEKTKIIRKTHLSIRMKSSDYRVLDQLQKPKQSKITKRPRDSTSSSSDGKIIPTKFAPRQKLLAESNTSKPRLLLQSTSKFEPIIPNPSQVTKSQGPVIAPTLAPVVDFTQSLSSSGGGVLPPPMAESSPARKLVPVEATQQE